MVVRRRDHRRYYGEIELVSLSPIGSAGEALRVQPDGRPQRALEAARDGEAFRVWPVRAGSVGRIVAAPPNHALH